MHVVCVFVQPTQLYKWGPGEAVHPAVTSMGIYFFYYLLLVPGNNWESKYSTVFVSFIAVGVVMELPVPVTFLHDFTVLMWVIGVHSVNVCEAQICEISQ